jgi:hypothetical protein
MVNSFFLSFFLSPWLYSFLENLGRLLTGGFKTVFSTFDRNRWIRGCPVARSLPIQDSSTSKEADKHPCLERDSNPRSEYPSDQDPRLDPRCHCDRHRNLKVSKSRSSGCFNVSYIDFSKMYFKETSKLN